MEEGKLAGTKGWFEQKTHLLKVM